MKVVIKKFTMPQLQLKGHKFETNVSRTSFRASVYSVILYLAFVNNMGGYIFYVFLILGNIFLQNVVHCMLPMAQYFPMGYEDEEFRIKKIVAQTLRKDIGSYRLPKTVKPLHYDLEIRPILENPDAGSVVFTAPGKVSIRVSCIQATNVIVLHSKNLQIRNKDVSVTKLGNTTKQVKVTGHNFDEEKSFYTIFLDRDMGEHGEYLVTIHFTAPIVNGQTVGIYRTHYVGSDGTNKVGAVTQFQKDDASRAFPCFDEPALKATFSVKIGRLSGYQSFSNMRKTGEPEPIDGLDGWVWDSYEPTLKLPVYLLAFAVLSDYIAQESPYRFQIKSWIPVTTLPEASIQFTIESSWRIMKFFEELFDIPFPLKKMDNLAVPDMHLFAMEHPGLVTYRPNFLVWRPDENTMWDKYQVATLIAHEYVHQWFGNLVTCEWWNDFWLNEGFARYFQFVGAQQSGEDFRSEDRFPVDVTQWAMEFDEGPNTVSVHAKEVDRVFYQPFHIEYEKGAALIRMMQTFLTQKTFIGGLRRYLKRHKFGNTVQDDLFHAFTEQATEDNIELPYTVGDIMKSWTPKTGFPILHVSRGDSDRIFITQQRFIIHPSATNKVEQGLWHVPVWYITQSNSTSFDGDNTPPNLWIDKNTLTAYITVTNKSEWIIVNPEARGYYRVTYDKYLTSLITEQLEKDHTVFNFATRSQLIDDYWRSAYARYINMEQALAIIAYLPKEDDVIVWTTAFNNFRRLFQRIVDTPLMELFKKLMLKLVKPPLARMGLILSPNASVTDYWKLNMMIDWLCTLDDEDCMHLTQDYFAKWMSDPEGKNPIPVDIQSQLYCAAISFSQNRTIHDFLLQHYKTTKSARQKEMVVRALTCDKHKDCLKTLFENAIDPNYTEINVTEHGGIVLFNLVRTQDGRDIAWDTIKNKYAEISNVLGPMAIPNVISSMAPFASNKGLSDINYEIMTFISLYLQLPDLSEAGQNTLQLSAQQIVDNNLWMDFFYDQLADYLKEYGRGP